MTISPLANPSATRALLETYGLATKHRLGQNFLIDNHVIERICALAELGPADRVLEVGPGIGTLTLALLQDAGRVASIEMDTELEPVLRAHRAAHEGFDFIMGDALKVEAARVAEALGGEPTAFVANLPYNVAATIILDFFERYPSVGRAVVMVQKEVADRIAAAPGTKAYGAYTAKLALFARVTGRFEVPPRCFMPAPHVDSAVVRIERRPASGEGAFALPAGVSRAEVATVVEAAFAQRRKTIRNSMGASGFDKDALDAAFATCGISPTARGESLAPERYVELAAALAEGAR